MKLLKENTRLCCSCIRQGVRTVRFCDYFRGARAQPLHEHGWTLFHDSPLIISVEERFPNDVPDSQDSLHPSRIYFQVAQP